MRSYEIFSHVVGVVNRYMTNPGEAVKWVLQYLRGTSITYSGCSDLVCGYVYLVFVVDLDKRRSTLGYVFTLVGVPISWM